MTTYPLWRDFRDENNEHPPRFFHFAKEDHLALAILPARYNNDRTVAVVQIQRGESMPAPEAMLDLYLHLASASEQHKRPLQRDKFLVLAARIALKLGYVYVAEDCRRRVLDANPNHILKNYATIHEALRSHDVRQYTQQLMRIYPFEKAEYLLHKYQAGGYSGDHGYSEVSSLIKPKPTAPPPAARKNGKPTPKHEKRKAPKTPTTPANGAHKPVNGNGSGPRSAIEEALERASERRPVRALPADLDMAPLPVPPNAHAFAARNRAGVDWNRINWTFLCWLVLAFAAGMALCGVLVFAIFFRGS